MAAKLSSNPNFIGSQAHAELSRQPLGFIDVGARGGAHRLIDPIADLTAVMCFEADEPEFERLKADARAWPFAAARIVPTALADRSGEATLYLTRNPNNISLLKPDADFSARYGNQGLDIVGEAKVKTSALDDVVFGDAAAGPRWGEVLKVDAQGADYMILQGARRTLAEHTVAVVCEALMMPMYEGQGSFSEIEIYLRELGFSFYGFIETNMRSRRLLDKRAVVGRERLFWADAVFLKDPISATNARPQLSQRQLAVLFVTALLLGFHDFALELSLSAFTDQEEVSKARRLIADLGGYDPHRTLEDLRRLLAQAEAQPGEANVIAGRYVDERRTNFDYRDIPPG